MQNYKQKIREPEHKAAAFTAILYACYYDTARHHYNINHNPNVNCVQINHSLMGILLPITLYLLTLFGCKESWKCTIELLVPENPSKFP